MSENGIKHVNLSVNLGIGGAVQTGYLYGCQNGYDLAVQFDGDGQHDASYLEQMAEELERTGSDMVIGSRFIEKGRISVIGTAPCGNPLFLSSDQTDDRKAGDRSHFRYAYGEPSGYGDLRTELSKDYPEPESVMAILRMGKKVTELPVVMREREEGSSSIAGFKSAYYMIKVTLAISDGKT